MSNGESYQLSDNVVLLSTRLIFRVIPELDLHGLTVDEALPKLKYFLYDSFMAGLTSLCINHGKGTGILRQTVYHELKNHSLSNWSTTKLFGRLY
jgi:dsDNA-specific endonuclease/ATPase MutS2